MTKMATAAPRSRARRRHAGAGPASRSPAPPATPARSSFALLARHPAVALTEAMSSGATSAPRPLPALQAHLGRRRRRRSTSIGWPTNADIVFLALPEAAAAEVGATLLQRGVRVIDLSGAFRIRNDADRQRWYPATTSLPAGRRLSRCRSGMQTPFASARLVSCPGCYPTAALLALEPLAAAGLLEGGIVVDAKSGISGAGKAPSERTHFCENHGSVAAYGVFSHRHTAEIEQELGRTVTFVPHLVPLDRGILETIYVSLRRGTTEAQVAEALHEAYASQPFVRLTGGELPEIKHVAHTNFCDIGWRWTKHARAAS